MLWSAILFTWEFMRARKSDLRRSAFLDLDVLFFEGFVLLLQLLEVEESRVSESNHLGEAAQRVDFVAGELFCGVIDLARQGGGRLK